MITEKFELFIIKAEETLQNALMKIEENKYQTLLVIDEDLRVLGTLTDGDVRKALLAKRTLFAPVYDVMNTNYKSVLNKAQAQEIFSKHFYINLIPIINEKGILQDIVYRDK